MKLRSLEDVVVIAAGRTLWTRRERPTKGGGDPGLIRQILDLDDSTVHFSLAYGVLFDLY